MYTACCMIHSISVTEEYTLITLRFGEHFFFTPLFFSHRQQTLVSSSILDAIVGFESKETQSRRPRKCNIDTIASAEVWNM